MLLYKRYIIKDILPALGIITFSLTSVIWITQILKYLYLIDKGIKIADFAQLIILIIPSLLFILLPFATITAVIYVYIHLIERRHTIILQGIGLDNIRIAIPALIVSLAVTLLSYSISFSLLPSSYRKLRTTLNFMKNNYALNMLEEKTFNKVSKNLIVYFDNKLPNNLMNNLVIFDNHIPNNQTILIAKSGTIKISENKYTLQLKNGFRQENDRNGNLTNLSFDTLTVELLAPATQSNLLDKSNNSSNEYYINELLNPDSKLSKNRKNKLIADGHQRLIWPLYNFILVFSSLSVFLRQPYDKKSLLKPVLVTVSFILIVLYAHFAMHNLASKNLIFILGCYGNIIIILLFSLYLYKKI